MFVFDTSAYLNGWRHHFRPRNFPGVWALIESALDDERILSPRAVYTEIEAKDDDVFAWAKPRAARFVDPSEEIQRAAGVIQADFPETPLRNAADPWVVAEARARQWVVVTYEGQTFSGVPTTRWHRSMPGVCQHYVVQAASLSDAIDALGGVFN